MGRVFKFRSSRVRAMHLLGFGVKLPNFKLQARPKQFLRYRYSASHPGVNVIKLSSFITNNEAK